MATSYWARLLTADGQHHEGDGLAVGDVIAEVVTESPLTLFTEEIAAQFVPVVAGAVYMATWDGSAWVAPLPPEAPPAPEAPPPPPPRKLLSRVEFKMQFTPAEYAGITVARGYSGTDEARQSLAYALQFFFEVLDDPGLNTVDLTLPFVVDGVHSLELASLLAAGRANEVLAGVT